MYTVSVVQVVRVVLVKQLLWRLTVNAVKSVLWKTSLMRV